MKRCPRLFNMTLYPGNRHDPDPGMRNVSLRCQLKKGHKGRCVFLKLRAFQKVTT
jgi:hypothetical protein